MTWILSSLLILSVGLNFFQFFLFKKQKRKPQPTYDAKKVLAALSRGRAVLDITVKDPGDFFMMSPRDMG